MRISLDALLVLDAIDRHGSIAGAATEIHRVSSTLSYTVAKLERDLGISLFDRAGPKLSPTAAGRELLTEGRYLLRAAQELEQRVRRVATGWETQFSIALEGLLAPSALAGPIGEFYRVSDSTRLRVSQEVMSGMWEALLDGRADLLIAAAGEGPSGGGYVAEPMGSLHFVFAVAPEHPLAALDRPLTAADLREHRAIAVGDSARRISPRTVGLIFGQDTLTVPDVFSKHAYQLAGFGFGFLPEPYARPAIEAGLLVECQVEEHRADERFYLAWRPQEAGAALSWWLQRLRQPGTLDELFEHTAQAQFRDVQASQRPPPRME